MLLCGAAVCLGIMTIVGVLFTEIIACACMIFVNPVHRIELQPPADSEIQVVSKLTEFRFNMKTGQASEHIIDLEGVNDDQVVDFPRVNENLLGRPTQFAYVSCLRAGKTLVESLLKVIICSSFSFAPVSTQRLFQHRTTLLSISKFSQGGPQGQKTCGTYFAWRVNQRRRMLLCSSKKLQGRR
jgi:hypothetical protein